MVECQSNRFDCSDVSEGYVLLFENYYFVDCFESFYIKLNFEIEKFDFVKQDDIVMEFSFFYVGYRFFLFYSSCGGLLFKMIDVSFSGDSFIIEILND